MQLNEKRAFLIVLVFLGLCFLFLLRPVFISLLLAAIITILLYPLYNFFLKFFRGKIRIASFVSTFLIFLIFVLPVSLIAALLVDQVVRFVSEINWSEAFASFMSLDFYQTSVQPLVEKFESRFNTTIDFAGLLTKLGTELARYAYNFSPQVLLHTATFIFSFIIMHISIYFLFIEGKKVFKTVLDLSPLRPRHEERLVGEFKNMIYATVYGYLFTALIQGALAGVGFWIAGVPAPLIYGTLTFFMSMVPVFGATAVWLPIAIWLFVKGDTGWAIFMAIYGTLIISGIDNIVKPFIVKEKAKIHILLIFFSLLGGIMLLGPIGILIGPVITAMFLACIKIYREEFLRT